MTRAALHRAHDFGILHPERRIQYNPTADLRAMATVATAWFFRCASRRYCRRNVGVVSHRYMRGLDQQRAHEGVALLADRSQPLPPGAQVPAQGQGLQSVLHARAHLHPAVPVVQQHPRVALSITRQPDAREFSFGPKFHPAPGVTAVVLLRARLRGPNLGRVPDPPLVSQFTQHLGKPERVPGALDPHQRRRRQARIERSHFPLQGVQAALLKLPALESRITIC
jgi:hypothetical protein